GCAECGLHGGVEDGRHHAGVAPLPGRTSATAGGVASHREPRHTAARRTSLRIVSCCACDGSEDRAQSAKRGDLPAFAKVQCYIYNLSWPVSSSRWFGRSLLPDFKSRSVLLSSLPPLFFFSPSLFPLFSSSFFFW